MKDINASDEQWHKDKTNLPSEGSLLDVIISYSGPGEPVGLLAAVIENGRIMMPHGGDRCLDITDETVMWHQIPNIIVRDGKVFFVNRGSEAE